MHVDKVDIGDDVVINGKRARVMSSPVNGAFLCLYHDDKTAPVSWFRPGPHDFVDLYGKCPDEPPEWYRAMETRNLNYVNWTKSTKAFPSVT